MAHSEWLPLTNYSAKYGISLSTLRRRIKADTILFKLEQGKYYIKDQAPQKEREDMPQPRSSQHAVPQQQHQMHHQQQQPMVPQHQQIQQHQQPQHQQLQQRPQSMQPSGFVEASVLSSANRLVEEIKAAYAKILQEKEEQISQLKEEIVDLRMLVRILEESKAPQPTKNTIGAGDDPTPTEFSFSDFQNRDI